MKKLAPIVAIALGAMFTSCKKTYTCSCTYDLLGTSQTYTWETGKVSKSDAKSGCEGYTATGWQNIKCTLK